MDSPVPYVLLGTITRAHGLRGEVKLLVSTESPGNIRRYRHIYLSVGNEGSKRIYTNLLARSSGNSVILQLKECSTREEAEQLTGCKVWLASTDLPEIGPGEFYLYTLEGKQAKTVSGLVLGTVVAILNAGQQNVLVIRSPEEEFLVPAVKEFIVAIDEETVVLAPPPGLLEINR